MQTRAYGAESAESLLAPLTIPRRDIQPTDVRVDVTHCGICHSDIHTAKGDWKGTQYPCVPGHEIVGRVAEVGAEVTRFAVGDTVGIGVIVDSCGECSACTRGLENYCRKGATGTYNGKDRHGTAPVTYGGYSATIVVTERFVHALPEGLDPAAAAPILCAGITMYSPLKHWQVGPGTRVGIAGFGGLGGMGVKLAKAMGAEVTVISRSDKKAGEAKQAGADHVLVSTDRSAMRDAARSLDLILSTIPKDHDLQPYLRLLDLDGTYVVLGAIEPLTTPFHGGMLMQNRLTIAGSNIGGVPETQELLEFCAKHGITADVQVIGVDRVNDAYAELQAGDPGYRYVIDMSTLTEA
ncbi:MAG: NAD(P)-dependent alcohol dehydrogenase [Jatrophihabitans sp.]|uniref:NAD(P)-dependent alcohol dehydrogenase n=1 Tax=Jatrophihabitans sp. TaxID=1932789 RepID=UPI003F7F625E